jgi:hypothetical protein
MEEMGLDQILESKQSEDLKETEIELELGALKKVPKEKKETKLKRKRKQVLLKIKVTKNKLEQCEKIKNIWGSNFYLKL